MATHSMQLAGHISDWEKYDSAKWYLSNAASVFHAQHNINGEATVLINLGNVNQTEHDYHAALNNLLAATQLQEIPKE